MQRQCIVLQFRRAFRALALYFIAAQLVHGLRRQADMGADGDAALGEETHGFGQPGAAFDFDHVRASLHQDDSVRIGCFRRAVRAERQVGHDHGRLAAARDGRRVVGQFGHGDGQGGIVAIADHAERIADQQDLHAAAVHQGREAGVIAGQHGDLFAGGAQRGQRVDGHGLVGDRLGWRRRRCGGLVFGCQICSLQISGHRYSLE
ncbi:hypothetical protein D3C72_1461030 [compost metagenome]